MLVMKIRKLFYILPIIPIVGISLYLLAPEQDKIASTNVSSIIYPAESQVEATEEKPAEEVSVPQQAQVATPKVIAQHPEPAQQVDPVLQDSRFFDMVFKSVHSKYPENGIYSNATIVYNIIYRTYQSNQSLFTESNYESIVDSCIAEVRGMTFDDSYAYKLRTMTCNV